MSVQRVTNEQIIEALHLIGPYASKLAKALGMNYYALKQRFHRNKKLQEAFDEEREAILDICEDNVIKAAKEGNLKQSQFLLRTLGKERGYTLRDEVTGRNGQPLQNTVIGPNLDDMSQEQLDAYLDGLLKAAEAIHGAKD